jgi:crotonobetainyl-CoA:carnitine CoA-transferase CaiB-like acyl-CoA transferase
VPVKLSASPGGVRAVPPELGADTDAFLAANGFAAGEIAALRAAGAI